MSELIGGHGQITFQNNIEPRSTIDALREEIEQLKKENAQLHLLIKQLT